MDREFIGVISDTHGLLRPEALGALDGAALILHAGDIGTPDILVALARIAPVFAVRGNNDRGTWAGAVPETRRIDYRAFSFYLLHDVHALDLDPRDTGYHAVVTGHSHKPAIAHKDGVLYLNPGSAGPRRFTLPISVARITVQDGRLLPEIVPLPIE
jgi:uncharacterized protein